MTYEVGIIGLGYVGLQLAVEFGKKINTIGIDKSIDKINNLKKDIDTTQEISKSKLKLAKFLSYTNEFKELKNCKYIIVAVPTPINKKIPDLTLLKMACKSIGRYIKKNSIIIFESTVYPGTTEDICVPLIEKTSQLKWKQDFHVGYSPERINPGDKTKTLCNIDKVVSGDTNSTLKKIGKLYSKVVNKKISYTSSIKVAEMSKVLENTQRDLNIALMNEVAIICNKLKLNTNDVIDAAKSKWNFIPFEPGLVGGHCIGVDPYYLTYKAQKIGYNPKVILSGRKINDMMPRYVSSQIKKIATQPNNKKINILGITFKENCADIRNTKVYDIYKNLAKIGFDIRVHDPVANILDVKSLLKIDLVSWEKLHEDAHILILAVKHDYYNKLDFTKYKSIIQNDGKIFDIKSILSKNKVKKLGLEYFNL